MSQSDSWRRRCMAERKAEQTRSNEERAAWRLLGLVMFCVVAFSVWAVWFGIEGAR